MIARGATSAVSEGLRIPGIKHEPTQAVVRVSKATLLLLAGCGKRVPPWGTVTGVVTQEGKPLPTTLIMFSNREAGVEIVTVTDARWQVPQWTPPR